MGGKGSGRPAKLKGIYKVFGLTTYNLDHYFYLGITKGFLCTMKAQIDYMVRTEKGAKALNTIIEELEYEYKIELIEVLPKEYNFQQAKLYLQENYLNKYSNNIVNTNRKYEFNPKEIRNSNLPEEIKIQIYVLYSQGITAKKIANQLNIPQKRINNVLRYAGLNKHQQFLDAKQQYENGISIKEIIEEYPILSPYLISKLKGK